MSDFLPPHRLYSPWNSPGQNAGVGGCSLLQGIFPTQGLNPVLPHCRQILYQLSHKGSPYYVDGPSSIKLTQGTYVVTYLEAAQTYLPILVYHHKLCNHELSIVNCMK